MTQHKTAKMQLNYEQKDADINLLMLRHSFRKQQHASRLIYYDRVHDLMMTC